MEGGVGYRRKAAYANRPRVNIKNDFVQNRIMLIGSVSSFI